MDNQARIFLRLPDVLRIIPISKSSWWRGREGRFPKPVKLLFGHRHGYRVTSTSSATGWPGRGEDYGYFEDEELTRIYLQDMSPTQISYLLRAGHRVQSQKTVVVTNVTNPDGDQGQTQKLDARIACVSGLPPGPGPGGAGCWQISRDRREV